MNTCRPTRGDGGVRRGSSNGEQLGLGRLQAPSLLLSNGKGGTAVARSWALAPRSAGQTALKLPTGGTEGETEFPKTGVGRG